MKSTYFAALAISSLITVGTATVGIIQPAQANPCAAAEVNPCAAVDPCAAVNPCAAAVDPCAAAAADPCAAAVDPCAAAIDPCAAAADPCAAAADPCAATADPCAATVDPCAGATESAIKSGVFQDVAQSTSGGVTIVEENGKRYLELKDTFRSDNGPDLFVLLHKEASPQDYSPEQFVNLGVLQSTTGAQRYEIPSDVSIEEFASAVIWCREFNVTFGTALF